MADKGKISDLVEVRAHPTVVRLEDAASEWIEAAYLLTKEVRGHLGAIRQALGRAQGCGIFLIGHYGAGKSHFLAYLERRLGSGAFVPEAPDVVALSLLNYRSGLALEAIIGEALGLDAEASDRRLAWADLDRAHPRGLLLILDELSEFLRAKPSPHAFHEDVRFLQFLGEWARDRRFWVLAAMQEQIEHTGDLEYGLYRKIKDRYPLRLLLTPAHVRGLLGDCILVKAPGYAAAVERLARELGEAFPRSRVDLAELARIYPLHPATLELLEEVRDRFSSARGVVDFAVNQLRGNPERGIQPFLERPWGELLSPDFIVDHFRDLLEVQPDFLPLAQRLFPWYRKAMPELFPQVARQGLAWRLLKLLVLVHLSPEREALDPRQAAAWLLFKVTRVDPARNIALVEKTLGHLADQGRFVQRHGRAFRLSLEDDSAAALDRLLRRELEELPEDQVQVMEVILPHLAADAFDPWRLPRERWQPREVRWHFHPREYALWVGTGELPRPPREPALCLRLPWGEGDPAPGVWTLVPARIEVGGELRETAALVRLAGRVLGPEVRARLERRLGERLRTARGQIVRAWRDARLFDPQGRLDGGFSEPGPRPLDAWIEGCIHWLLRRTYPSFERFAPTQGPLPKDAYRQFMRAVEILGLEQPRSPEASEYLDLVREGYLLPMGLLRREGRGYRVSGRLERHELVRLLRPLLEHRPAPQTLYSHLAQPVYGLVPDQVHLLLIFLLIQGEIEILKAGRSYRDHYETLPLPVQYDRIEPAQALDLEQIQGLERLSEGLDLPLAGQWTVLAQRQAARRLRRLARERGALLEGFAARLNAQPGAEALSERVLAHRRLWRLLEEGDELDAVQRFLHQAAPVSRFLADAAELAALPARLDRLSAELSRFAHLFAQAPFDADSGHWAEALRALGETPGLDRGEDLEVWLRAARRLYDDYQRAYRAAHDAWWRKIMADPVWHWQPPALARSRHLHLEDRLQAFARLRREAEGMRCKGLSRLEFQTRCNCGFDGQGAPLAGYLERLRGLSREIQEATEAFFGRDEVRERIRSWLGAGHEVNALTQAYVRGEAPLPEVASLDLFDRHLAGVETLARLTPEELLGALVGRTWTPAELAEQLRRHLEGLGEAHIRIESTAPEGVEVALVPWVLEQALRGGVPVPAGLGRRLETLMAETLRPEWASPRALARLDRLGLGRAAEDRLLGWLLDGTLALPEGEVSPLVAALREIRRPAEVDQAADLGHLAAALYRAHPRLAPLADEAWTARLDALAGTRLAVSPPPLLDVLEKDPAEMQWLVIDALGLVCLELLEAHLADWLPQWRPAETGFALGPEVSDTSTFFAGLLEGEADRPLEKIDALDRLLHGRNPAFADLERLAAAEIGVGLGALSARLDPARPLRILADHGFRLDPCGRAWVHGGPSTLERVVLTAVLEPRHEA